MIYDHVRLPTNWRDVRRQIRNAVRCDQKRFNLNGRNDHTITTTKLFQLLHRQNYLCAICQKADLRERMQLDHIWPLSKGGHHSFLNVQWVCRTCNLYKDYSFKRRLYRYHPSPPETPFEYDTDH